MGLTDALLLEPYPVKAFVALRNDSRGCGTVTDPYGVNSAESFDSLLNSLEPGTHLHLGPGVFETRGYYDGAPAGYGFQPKPGMKITGAGVDVTTIRLVGATVAGRHYYAIGHSIVAQDSLRPNLMDELEIESLTVDCNLLKNGQVACGAVRLFGNRARARLRST